MLNPNANSLAIASVLSLVLASTSQAQTARPDQRLQQNRQSTSYEKVHEDADVYKAIPLSQPVELPQVPNFSGDKKFVKGLTWPKQYGGPSYIMHFTSNDDARTVRDWYADALQSHNWKIFKSTNLGVFAKHPEGHYCYVTFLDRPGKGIKCRYTLNYHASIKK